MTKIHTFLPRGHNKGCWHVNGPIPTTCFEFKNFNLPGARTFVTSKLAYVMSLSQFRNDLEGRVRKEIGRQADKQVFDARMAWRLNRDSVIYGRDLARASPQP